MLFWGVETMYNHIAVILCQVNFRSEKQNLQLSVEN